MLDRVGYNTSGLSQQTISRLNEIANFIERDKKYGFAMWTVLEHFSEDEVRNYNIEFDPAYFCGTAGCIAGYVKLHLNPDKYMTMYEAGDWLGLPFIKYDRLFNAVDSDGESHTFSSITRAIAVQTMRNLAETGEVSFAQAKREVARR